MRAGAFLFVQEKTTPSFEFVQGNQDGSFGIVDERQCAQMDEFSLEGMPYRHLKSDGAIIVYFDRARASAEGGLSTMLHDKTFSIEMFKNMIYSK